MRLHFILSPESLPIDVYLHCIIALSSTQFILIGGSSRGSGISAINKTLLLLSIALGPPLIMVECLRGFFQPLLITRFPLAGLCSYK